jgi:uncharacterized protein
MNAAALFTKTKLFTLIYLWCIPFVLPAAIPERPDPPCLVNDLAGLFTAGERAQLEHTLAAFNDTTSNQIVVLTVPDLDGQEASAFAYQVGETWKVGQEKFDNGVVILVKPKPANGYGDVFIAVGYGLEGALPDAVCKTIIEKEMIPYFRDNNYFGGVQAALAVIMPVAAGEYVYAGTDETNSWQPLGVLLPIIISILFVLFVIIRFEKNNSGNHHNGGSRGGFSGGGFSGRGASSGRSGGGFSGGGFGGFGGGSFGGGGAGSRW